MERGGGGIPEATGLTAPKDTEGMKRTKGKRRAECYTTDRGTKNL